MALEVADVDAVRERLSAQGVEFNEGGNQSLGMDQIFCLDPDGHVIEFASYAMK
jgi:catechol 2,3-dioxygenase-like lactoylglutathione lyase family enzyme